MSVKIKADIRHWLRELDKKYFFVMLGDAGLCGDSLFSADQLEADEHSGWSVDNG